MFKAFSKELLQALRVIAKTPTVSIIAVASLALGIAANTTIFSLFHSFLLRPLPYEDPDQLVVVWESQRTTSDDQQPAAPANFFDWRQQSTSFEALIAADFGSATLTDNQRPEQLSVAHVTPDLFATLGSEALRGRTFRADEGQYGAAPVVVLSESLWRGTLGADESIIGSSLILDDEAHTVAGVMPEAFDFLLGTVDLWIASDFTALRDDRSEQRLVVAGRLKPDRTLAQAQTEMSAIASRLESRFPETNEGYGIRLQRVRDVLFGATDKRLVQILMIVSVLVLLVACVNVASLLLAKSDARHKEIAIKTALGAPRGRLFRQMLTESLVLASVAGIFGTVFSIWGIHVVAGSLPDLIPSFHSPRLDPAVLTFSFLISLLAGLAFGISPALHAVRGSLLAPLLDNQRGSTSTRERKRMLGSFVVAEFALALTILIGAAVLTEIFRERLAIDPGFDSRNLLTAKLELPEHRFADDDSLRRFISRLHPALEGIGGALDATLVSNLPRTRTLPYTDLEVDGQAAGRNQNPRTSWLAVQPGYFEAMGIDLMEGRAIATTDRADSAPVVVVNQVLVERHLASSPSVGSSPIGRQITVEGTSRAIVGVVGNVAQERMSGLEPLAPAVYFPLDQHPTRQLYAILRSPTDDPLPLAAPLQQAIGKVDSRQPVSDLRTMDAHIELELAGPTVITRVLYGIGSLALVLAAIGIFGVMTFTVSQQTGEIGLRMALGARPVQILARVTRQGAKLAGLGLLLGIPAAAGVVHLIGSLFEAAASDGLETTAGIALQPIFEVGSVLCLVGLLACYLPARWATRIDPVTALQAD